MAFSLFAFVVCLCYAVLSVPCSLVVTCWESANLLALLYVVFSCASVTFLYGVPGQVWYLIVSITDLCLLLYIYQLHNKRKETSSHIQVKIISEKERAQAYLF